MGDFASDIPLEQVKPSAWNRLLDAVIPARRRNRELLQENRRLEAFLHAVPIEYCALDQTGVQAISPGFCPILGIAKVSSLEDIQAAITAGDAAALEGLFDRLQQYGENFEIGVNTGAGGKTLKISGKRGAIGDGSQGFSVIWIPNITDFAQAAARGLEASAA